MFIYDIRSEELAQKTLINLTGIPLNVWEENLNRECDYEYQDAFLAAMIRLYSTKLFPRSCEDMEFVYLHVTTSANGCESIKQHGLLDLKGAYLCEESELRQFLDAHDVAIDLGKEFLIYHDVAYDIHYGECPRWHESKAQKRWDVGRKFFYDFTTCGFLSVCNKSAYGGQVHRRPEILDNIDSLLRTRLADEWERTHEPYEVAAKVSGADICCSDSEEDTEEEKVMSYICKAYNNAFYGCSERILLMKNGIHIPPEGILNIKPLDYWERL